MIARISGNIIEKRHDSVLLDVNGLGYEVLIPVSVMDHLSDSLVAGEKLDLVTYYYLHLDPSKGFPFLIGFSNTIEKEFFEKFISVSGIGPKAACRALAEPFSHIARAIDIADSSFLKKLPGIGERKANEIIAKLKGRVGKYGLIKDEDVKKHYEKDDIMEEAMAILLQLQYKKLEAEEMIKKALKQNPKIKTSEDLLNEVYRSRS